MIVSDYVLTHISNRNKGYYQKLGYNCNFGDDINVKVSDLSKCSTAVVDVKCDYCGKIFSQKYSVYTTNKSRTIVNQDCCQDCQPVKSKAVAMKKYGLPHTSHLEEVKEKRLNTMLERYGVDNPSKLDDVKEKKRQTCLSHYGVDNYVKTNMYRQQVINTSLEKYGIKTPSQTDIAKEKRRKTCLKKYGVDVALKSDIVREKMRQTNLQKYGYECVFENENIKEKIRNTLCTNGNVLTSSQQLAIYQLLLSEGYDVKINYPVDKFSLDIALFYCNKKIDIEYDGWYWHQNKHKDAIRNGVLINQFGWKVIRVKSGNLLPDIALLKDAISTVVNTEQSLYSIKLSDWKENL